VLLVKNGAAAEVRLVPSFRNFRPMTPAPAFQLQLPFTTDLNWIPPSSRRRFKSLIGDCEPEKSATSSNFHLARHETETTRSAVFLSAKKAKQTHGAFEHPSEQGRKINRSVRDVVPLG